MTESERGLLERRLNELAPLMVPADSSYVRQIQLAIADMFGAYRSMRQTGDEAVAIVEATALALREFPAWATVKACKSIQSDGVWRDGKFDRQWPPNDADIFVAVRKEMQLYESQHRSVVALLAASVEES